MWLFLPALRGEKFLYIFSLLNSQMGTEDRGYLHFPSMVPLSPLVLPFTAEELLEGDENSERAKPKPPSPSRRRQVSVCALRPYARSDQGARWGRLPRAPRVLGAWL